MNEIVKYHNDMNTVALRKFNSVEMNIFMAICSRMREKEEEIAEFSFDYIKNLIKIEGNYTVEQFGKLLDNTYEKLLKTSIKIGNDRVWTRFVLFTKYKINLDKQSVLIKVNDEFKWVLNELTKKFTRFELEEYIDYKSSYTKEFFRRMKEFRTTGIWKISLEEFKQQLDIPQNYRTTDIDKWVLSPILKELKKDYKLKVKKIYSKQGVGRPKVSGFEFRFITEEIKQKQTAEEEQKKIKKLKIYNPDIKANEIYEIVSTYTNNDIIYLKLRNIENNIEKIKQFNNIQHYTNFVLKYSVKK